MTDEDRILQVLTQMPQGARRETILDRLTIGSDRLHYGLQRLVAAGVVTRRAIPRAGRGQRPYLYQRVTGSTANDPLQGSRHTEDR